MRKNGVNRELTFINGGVCAPQGFRASGVFCGFTQAYGTREDLALILADKRVPTACVFSEGGVLGATAVVTRNHMQLNRGLAQAILVNSGVAIVAESGVMLAETVCRETAKRLKLSREDILIASTGKIGKPLTLSTYSQGLNGVITGLGDTKEHSLQSARAIMTTDKFAKQIAFSFYLGDTPCKIGAIFKGCVRTAPNMATTLCFLTTDVCIAPETLQKALSSAVKDSFNLLNFDGDSSPNDSVCIMASGLAGNYKITAEDTEYEKFRYLLTETLLKICRALACENEDKRLFSCKTYGAKSKRAARAIARSVVSSQGVRQSLKKGALDVESLFCAIHTSWERVRIEEIFISVKSTKGEIVLFEDGKQAEIPPSVLQRLFEGEEMEILLGLGKGNYFVTALGLF